MPPAQLTQAIDELLRALRPLRFKKPVTHVYNPLIYARAAFDAYLTKYGASRPRQAFLLGMNPGPWGMAQTGVPFGEVSLVRDWMGIRVPIKKPENEHPARPIEGFECKRSEVSGARLWGFAKSAFGKPEAFFERFFVYNYCPLVFMEESGKNFTPDKLPQSEAAPLYQACDRALASFIAYFEPTILIGVGGFAEERLKAIAGDSARVGRILHPSPASPLANKDWPGQAAKALRELGIEVPG